MEPPNHPDSPDRKRRRTEYSNNKYTIKNREAYNKSKKKGGEDYNRKKDKTADNTAYSRFCNNTFLKHPAVLQILSAEPDQTKRAELIKDLKIQAHNVAV